MKIALDVLGGDNAPLSTIKGALAFLEQSDDSAPQLILVGDSGKIKQILNSLNGNTSKIEIVHTTEIVGMHEKPSRIFREKPDSSLVRSIQLVKEDEAQAVVSAGNTGALLATSLFLIGKIPGIRRPAFAPFIPSNKGGFILCDAGANADCKPVHLVQFGLMAGAYIEHLEDRPNPRVALLNIGSEKVKGNELTSTAYPLMEEHLNNFIGNLEPRYIMDGKADVVVCDGFTGNIVLKQTEGLILHLMSWIQERINVHSAGKDPSPVFSQVFSDIQSNLDHEEYGATPLLGINGVVMKCHGSATARGIKNSLLAAQKTVEENLIEDIADRLSSHSDIFEENNKLSETNPV
ncbi:MAG: phosphate acyltransferase PlsX [Candidatus Marinimicrobia bacterium]|jgi:glycerol-3-phosphate acyltransferase PlsX|nr:phosphate acyltransferase PlsX [Candidatus Neomarinimicrobiota bacterium]